MLALHFSSIWVVYGLVVASLVKYSYNASCSAPPSFSSVHVLHRKPDRAIINLDCSADGKPRPTVVWLKNGKPFFKRDGVELSLRPYQYVLRLRGVVSSDNGQYTCNVSNSCDWISRTFTVHVKKREPSKPLIQIIPNVTARNGDNVTLKCNAMSDSMPRFRWLILTSPQNASSLINETPNHYKVIKQSRHADYIVRIKHDRWRVLHVYKLMLVNVGQKHVGMYTCNASNTHGFSLRHTFLTVASSSTQDITTPIRRSRPTEETSTATRTVKTQHSQSKDVFNYKSRAAVHVINDIRMVLYKDFVALFTVLWVLT
ncbi:fibroblast growth factor receptor 4 [Nematostella vectensis]|uniref:fibroblast growth factor receptor 4 n=1 Tax=Nematostella vectensis TaxID=45351 RepID=UPI00207795B0|nr:fibroblast growth factor receptor 4 [Nematostella vectensis]